MRGTNREGLLSLYRKLLRSARTFPSVKKEGIYQAIREEWKDWRDRDPNDKRTQQQVNIAFRGLAQLRQFDVDVMTKGKGAQSSEWKVDLDPKNLGGGKVPPLS